MPSLPHTRKVQSAKNKLDHALAQGEQIKKRIAAARAEYQAAIAENTTNVAAAKERGQ